MKSSYDVRDVKILLKDISGMVEPLPTEIREKNIQNGMHYSEMLPLEYVPSEEYMSAYQFALSNFSEKTAEATMILGEKIYQKKGNSIVLVSLARAGIPVGILLKRYLEKKYICNVTHYAISIIRGRGIDTNALNYILKRHNPKDIQFIDGWTGKGAIYGELQKALEGYPQIECSLGVISDPAEITNLCGTSEDILIPSSCLNSIVTGLISRTFFRDDIIRENEFHGAIYYSNLEKNDLSQNYLEIIESFFSYNNTFDLSVVSNACKNSGKKTVLQIGKEYGVRDINLIKPGIGEATRVLLRRVPWKILLNKNINFNEVDHIIALAKEKGVPVEFCKCEMGKYKACGLIKQLGDI